MKKSKFSLAFSLMEILISVVIISTLLAAFIPIITKKLTARMVYIADVTSESEDEYIIPQSQDDCPSYSVYTAGRTDGEDGGYCVIKWNVGDDEESGRSDFALPSKVKIDLSEYDGTNPETIKYSDSGTEYTIHQLTAGSGSAGSCSTSTSTSSFPTNGLCCWQGTTSGTCNSSDGASPASTYDGCTRTVCTWHAAVALCENWAPSGTSKGDWHAPTQAQLQNWRTTSTSSSAILSGYNSGPDGLQLCDDSSGYSAVQCYLTSACTGAFNSHCIPYRVWSRSVFLSSLAYAFYLSSGTFTEYRDYPSRAFSVRCLAEKVPRNLVETLTPETKEEVSHTIETTADTSSVTLEIPSNLKSATIKDIYSQGGTGGAGNAISSTTYKTPESQADCPKAADGSDYTVYINGTCVAKWNMGDSRQSGNSDFALPATVKINTSTGAYSASGTSYTVQSLKAGSGQCSCVSLSSTDYCLCCWGKNGTTSGEYTSDDGNGSTYSGQKRTVCNWHAAVVLCSNWAPNGTKAGDWHLPTWDQMSNWRVTPSSSSALKSGLNIGSDGLQLCSSNSGYSAVQCAKHTSACPNSYTSTDSGFHQTTCTPYILWSKDVYGSSKGYSPYFIGTNFIENHYDFWYAHSVRCLIESVPITTQNLACAGGGSGGYHQSDIEIPSDVLTSAVGGKIVIDRNYTHNSKTHSAVLVYDSSDTLLWAFLVEKGVDATTPSSTSTTPQGAKYDTTNKVCSKYESGSWTNSYACSGASDKTNNGADGAWYALTSNTAYTNTAGKGGAYDTYTGGSGGTYTSLNGSQGTAYSAGGGGGCANYAGTKGSGGLGGIGYINLEYVTLE